MNIVEQNAALKAKNRELHAEIDRLTQELADLRVIAAPTYGSITDSDLTEFVAKIAETKSKFAKEARELLG